MRMVHDRVMVTLDHICCDIGRGSCEPSHRCLLDHLPNSHVVLTPIGQPLTLNVSKTCHSTRNTYIISEGARGTVGMLEMSFASV